GLDRPRDDSSRWNERDGTARGNLAEPGVDLTARSLRKRGAELELRAPDHGRPGQRVLGDDLLHEAKGRDDLDVPCADVGLVDDAAHPTVVIGVTVGVDDRGDRSPPAVPYIKVHAGPCHFGRDQGIDHDEPTLALDDRHVREVEAADLIDAVADLEEAMVHVEPRVTPQAGIDG